MFIGELSHPAETRQLPPTSPLVKHTLALVAFEVGFTPSLSQIGQKPDIFKNIIFTGTDSVTGQLITVSSTSSDDVKNVSIDLRGDSAPAAFNSAVVAK